MKTKKPTIEELREYINSVLNTNTPESCIYIIASLANLELEQTIQSAKIINLKPVLKVIK